MLGLLRLEQCVGRGTQPERWQKQQQRARPARPAAAAAFVCDAFEFNNPSMTALY